MDTSKYDHLPPDLKEKILKANRAFEMAANIDELLRSKFAIFDLRVATTADKHFSISGTVNSDAEREEVEKFLLESGNVTALINGLTVVQPYATVELIVNGQKYHVQTLAELQTIFNRYSSYEFVEYALTGHGEKAIILLMNKTHSIAIYLRQEGDSGFTTYNPKGDDRLMEFVLANGQKDEYPSTSLVENKQAQDILRQYLLNGDRYDGVEWKEE